MVGYSGRTIPTIFYGVAKEYFKINFVSGYNNAIIAAN